MLKPSSTMAPKLPSAGCPIHIARAWAERDGSAFPLQAVCMSPLASERGHPLPRRRTATEFSWGQRGKDPPGGGIQVGGTLRDNTSRGLPDLTCTQGALCGSAFVYAKRSSAGKVQPQVLSHRQLFVPR